MAKKAKSEFRYAAEYGLEAVQKAVRHFDELPTSGYQAKSVSGLLVDILRDPMGYQTIEVVQRARPKLQMPKQMPVDETEPERTLQTANFILRKTIPPESDKAEVAELYLKGLVISAELATLATAEDALDQIYNWRSRQEKI